MNLKISPYARKKGYNYYPFQEKIISEMLAAPSPYLFNASHMGTGKSIMTYSYAYNKNFENVLIVCPASLRINWLRESIWAGKALRNGVAVLSNKDLDFINKLTMWKPGNDPSLLIVSYDMLVTNKRLRNYVGGRKWDYMACDEFHKCRNIETKRFKIIEALCERIPNYTFLTGTPVLKTAVEIYAALSLIIPNLENVSDEDYELCTDFNEFAHTFTYVRKSGYRKYNAELGEWKDQLIYNGARNVPKFKALVKGDPTFYFRQLFEDAVPDLPEKTYRSFDLNLDVDVDDTPEIQKFFDECEKGQDPNPNKHPQVGALKKLLGDAKANSKDLQEYVESFLEQGRPVALYAHHKSVIATLMKVFKAWKPVKIDGSVSPTKRQIAVDKFQSGESDVFIGQLQAAAEGLTLTRSCDIFFYELDWLPAMNEQCISRLYRIGQENAVTAHYPISKHKFDIKLVKGMISRQALINKII